MYTLCDCNVSILLLLLTQTTYLLTKPVQPQRILKYHKQQVGHMGDYLWFQTLRMGCSSPHYKWVLLHHCNNIQTRTFRLLCRRFVLFLVARVSLLLLMWEISAPQFRVPLQFNKLVSIYCPYNTRSSIGNSVDRQADNRTQIASCERKFIS